MEFKLNTLIENEIIDPNKITELICEGIVVWKGLSDDVASLENKYTFKSFNKDISEGFNKPVYSINVERKALSESKDEEICYGVEAEKKFPLDNKDHVQSAIKFFNYVKPEHEQELADKIIAKMHYYKISADHVGEKNRLCKYIDSCTADLSETFNNILCALLEDDEDDCLLENLDRSEKRRWRIIKNTMKFVDMNSVREAFPGLANSSNRNIVKQLKAKLEQLPEAEKRRLISLHQAKELEIKADQVVKHTGAGVGTGIALGGTGLSVAAGATFGLSTPVTQGATAVAEVFAKLILGVGLCALGSIVSIGAGVATGVGIGVGQMLNKMNDRRRKATMQTQVQIINALRKNPDALNEELRDEGGRKIPGYHKCSVCGANLDAWDGSTCEECRKQAKAKETEQSKKEWNKENMPEYNDGDGKGTYYLNNCNEKIYKKEEENKKLTEAPLYDVEDNKDGTKTYTELKNVDGSSIDTMDEVKELKRTGGIVKYPDKDGKKGGVGCFAPSGQFIDADYKPRNVELLDKDHKLTRVADKHTTFKNLRSLKRKEQDEDQKKINENISIIDDDLLFEQLLDDLDEMVLTESAESRMDRIRKALMMKPYKYLRGLSHNYAAEIALNTIGILSLIFCGIGMFGSNITNKNKLKFILDIVNRDPATCHWAHEIEKAANQTPPDKVAAKAAFKQFKLAVDALNLEQQWKEHKKELKAQLKLKKKNPAIAE